MNWQKLRVKPEAFALALREMTRALAEPRRWAMILAVVLLVAIAGPFYTMERLGLAGRIAYWAGIGVTSWLMMWALVRLAFALTPAHWPPVLTGALAGLAGVVPVMGLVTLANLAAGMGLPAGGFWGLAPYVAPLVTGISVLAVVFQGGAARATPPGTAQPPVTPPLFARLPARLGREIVTIQAQDHYVEVTTLRGSALILMRMGDAVQGLPARHGLQVHRSWWADLAYAERLEVTGAGRMALVMVTGGVVPVPRARQAALRKAMASAAPAAGKA